MNFGLFGLGDEQIGETGEVCESGCRKWPVHCLTTKLTWLPGTKANRAQAAASAWGGTIDHDSLCSGERRLESNAVGTKLACRIRPGAVSGGVGGVVAGLSSEAFSKGIILRTQEVLEADSDAFRGPLSLTRTLAWGTEETSRPESPKVAWPSWTIFSLIGIVGLPLLGVICVLVTRRKTQSGPTATAAEQSV